MTTLGCSRRWLVFAACLLVSACVGPALVITPDQLPNAVEGQDYSVSLSAADAYAGWTITDGSLPPGLVLDGQSGQISGVPVGSGAFAFTVSASDPRVPPSSGQHAYTLTVLPALQVQFNPTPARVSTPYDYTPTITGGVPPYTVQIIGLPGFLDYDPATGEIFGTLQPIAGYVYPNARLAWTVTDSGDPRQTQDGRATLVIHPLGVSIVTTALDPATIGTPYALQLVATNGRQPYTWAVVDGVLPGSSSDPDRLRLDTRSGLISGLPGAGAQTETFTIAVTDNDSPPSSAQRVFKLVVQVVIATTSLPAASVGTAYAASVVAVGGLPPYTWTVSAGQLPAGLTIDSSTGGIVGTPAPGATSQTFTLRVTDSDLPAAAFEQQLTIEVH